MNYNNTVYAVLHCFGEDYYIVKQNVIEELKMLSEQIKNHLGLQYVFFEGGENIDSK